jgi:hypothetical protein
LDHILLGDVGDGRFTPTRVPFTLLRLKPFRGYLYVTHSLDGSSKTCTAKKSLKTLFGTGFKKYCLCEQLA